MITNSSFHTGCKLFSTTFVLWLCRREGSAYTRTYGEDVLLRRSLDGNSRACRIYVNIMKFTANFNNNKASLHKVLTLSLLTVSSPKLETQQCCATSLWFLYPVFRRLKHVAQHCGVSRFLSMFLVFHLAGSTCRATKHLLLFKVGPGSTLSYKV